MAQSRSSLKAIAERYVKALFALALEAHKEVQVGDDLQALAAAIATSPELQRVLAHPTLPATATASAVSAVMQAQKADPATISMVTQIIANKRGGALIAVAQAYRDQLIAHQGALGAVVTTAVAATDAQQKQIAAALESAANKKVAIEWRVSPGLIGGLTIAMNGRTLDRSVAGKLHRLKASLASAV